VFKGDEHGRWFEVSVRFWDLIQMDFFLLFSKKKWFFIFLYKKYLLVSFCEILFPPKRTLALSSASRLWMWDSRLSFDTVMVGVVEPSSKFRRPALSLKRS